MESLLSQVPGQRKSTPSQQEFLLQGSIVNETVEDLLHRLRGLCDNPDSNTEPFHDHEMVFILSMCHDHELCINANIPFLL